MGGSREGLARVTRLPVVSVLMTAYNRERYLGSAIESVLAQTYGDFELVVVDDHSTDATVDIARRYERLDPRVRVAVNERNLGDYPNRNLAAALARARFIKFHDSDDLMYPHCLSVMVPALESEPRAAFALAASRTWPGGPCPLLSTPRMNYQREFLGFGLFIGGPACALFRTQMFRDEGGFQNYGAASDHLFWLNACARHSVLLLPGDLFWYRVHPGQELQSENAARRYAEVPGHVWRALAASACPLTGEELELARRNHAFGTAKTIARMVSEGRWALAAYGVRQSAMTIADWVTYLRPPRRSSMAGTPVDADGEYILPRWVGASRTADSAQ